MMSKKENLTWKRLIEQVSKTSSPQKIGTILATFTTAYERKQISKRVAALELLKDGKSYNQISKELWVSPTIISALKKSVESNGGYISSYERVKKVGKRQVWSSFPKSSRKNNMVLPHGKLIYPQKRRR